MLINTLPQLEESKLHMPKEEIAMLRPKASTSRLPGPANTNNAQDVAPQDGQAQIPASGVDAAADLPAATRSTSATKPNTIEQKLVRAHATKKRKMKEPNPLSVKKKKPNMTMPKKSASSSVSDTKENGLKQKGQADEVADPTKGVTRKQGDGQSKKALKRKQKKAQTGGQSTDGVAPPAAPVETVSVDTSSA